jgi:hypothetical protein
MFVARVKHKTQTIKELLIETGSDYSQMTRSLPAKDYLGCPSHCSSRATVRYLLKWKIKSGGSSDSMRYLHKESLNSTPKQKARRRALKNADCKIYVIGTHFSGPGL